MKKIQEGFEKKAFSWEQGLSEVYSKGQFQTFKFDTLRSSPVKVIKIILLSVFLVFAIRAASISFSADRDSAGKSNNFYEVVKSENRGVIFDRDGEVIALNESSYQILIDPLSLPKDEIAVEEIITFISELTSIDDKKIESVKRILDLDQSDKIVLKDTLSKDEYFDILPKIKGIDGIEISPYSQRVYTENSLAQTIGYVGLPGFEESKELQTWDRDILTGKTGLEKFYNSTLSGKFEVLDNGQKILQDFVEPHNLKTTIDLDLQKFTYEILENRIKRNGSEKGLVVAMNPQTGEILALVSYPTFDPNTFVRNDINSIERVQSTLTDENQPLLNRVVSGAYEPGSTFKPMIALGALQDGVVNKNTIINDTGSFKIDDHVFYGWKKSGLGEMDVRSAIAWSSNIYFYTIAGGREKDHGLDGLGYDRLRGWFQRFKISEPTNVDLPFEYVPDLPIPEYSGDVVQMGIGQGDVLLSPIRLATIISTIANNGYEVTPHLGNEITDQDGDLIEKLEFPKSENQIAFTDNLLIVREGMLETVQSGTAKSLSSLPFKSAGKTGTAENPQGDTHAWYTGFAPYENPQIVVVVLVENGGEGSEVSVPIAGEIMNYWWENSRD